MKHFKYHYFYKIENLINGKFYYGIHSTNNLDDGYMGSGSRIKESVKKYGKENFSKTIVEFFKTRELASEYESEVVTEELIHDKDCYNIRCGGDYGLCVDTILVKDKENRFHRATSDDEKILSGEWVPFMTGCVSVYDSEENEYKIISCEEYKANKKRYVSNEQNKVIVKDSNGNIKKVSIDDEKYLNGELVPIWCGKKHKPETIKRMKETHKKNCHQKGEKNSSYGTCWITKDKDNKKIKKELLNEYLSNGWIKGRYVSPLQIKSKTDVLNKDDVFKLYEENRSWRKVAKILNVSNGSLYRFLKRNS